MSRTIRRVEWPIRLGEPAAFDHNSTKRTAKRDDGGRARARELIGGGGPAAGDQDPAAGPAAGGGGAAAAGRAGGPGRPARRWCPRRPGSARRRCSPRAGGGRGRSRGCRSTSATTTPGRSGRTSSCPAGATDGAGAGALGLLPSRSRRPRRLASLLNDLQRCPSALMLVLDDYHLIESRDIHDAMAFLVEHLPANVHLVLATRADPPLPLVAAAGARRAGRGPLRRPAVHRRRGRRLPRRADGPGADRRRRRRAGRAHRGMGGRPAAGRACPCRTATTPARSSRRFAGDDRFIVDYLAEEVLARLPADVRDFLLRTSVLDAAHRPAVRRRHRAGRRRRAARRPRAGQPVPRPARRPAPVVPLPPPVRRRPARAPDRAAARPGRRAAPAGLRLAAGERRSRRGHQARPGGRRLRPRRRPDGARHAGDGARAA